MLEKLSLVKFVYYLVHVVIISLPTLLSHLFLRSLYSFQCVEELVLFAKL